MTWIALILLGVMSGDSDSWPAFLGAGANQQSQSPLPLNWTATENVAWITELPGHGQSSPVVYRGRVFATSVEGPNKETYQTVCIDLATGHELWKNSVINSSPVTNSYYVSRAAPTPVVDGKQIVVLFESGDCIAYSHDGEEMWRRALGKDQGPLLAEFGLGASPCQNATHLFVLLEHDGPSCLLAINKQTGETDWKADRTPRRSWSSPAMIDMGGETHVVVSSAGSVDGYDPTTGKLLWSFEDIGGNTATTPMDSGDGRLLIGASPGRNGENAGSAADSNCLLQVTREGDAWSANRKWIAAGAMPSWASPIIHQGLAYWINRAGVVHCFDAQSGDEIYKERIKQSSWATPIARGDRIYFFGQHGLVTVLATGREFKVLAENESWTQETLPPETALSEEASEERQQAAAMFSKPTLYGAANADGKIVLRVGNCLIAIADSDNGQNK